MKQEGTRYGFLLLFLSLAFTLICSLSAMAQGDPTPLGTYANPSTLNNGTAPLLEGFYSDPITYTLTGNMPPGEAFYNPNTNSTGSGQFFRGEGASLIPPISGINSDPLYTNSAVCTNMMANTYTSASPIWNGTGTVANGMVYPAMVQVQIGGSASQSMYCCSSWKATVNGTATTWAIGSYGYCSAGNFSNLEAYLLDENLNYNPTFANVAGSGITGQVTGTGANQGQAQQCMGCHGHMNVQASDGPAFLLSGHKNALRRVIPGVALAAPNGTPYPDINWANGTQYLGGAQAYYILGGWQDSSEVVFAQNSQTPLGDCARCHATGWNPVAPFTDTTAATAAYSGYPTYGSNLNTQSGPEPSVAALVNGTVLFNGSLSYSTVNGTTHVTSYFGYQNSTGVPAYSFESLATAGAILNTGFGTEPTGKASWYLNGVTCERCHYSDIGTQAVAATGEHAYGKDPSSTTSGISTIASAAPSGYSDAPLATGMNSFQLCIQCHRSETVTPGTPGTIAINWPVIVNSDLGSCANGSGDNYTTCTTTDLSTWNFAPTTGTRYSKQDQGPEQLASPHSKYIGPQPQLNNQNSADLSIASGTLNVATNFLTINESTVGAGPRGCTGCHDPHFTTVNVPNVPTNPSWGILYSDGGVTKVNSPSGPQGDMPPIVSAGAVSKNCNDAACHGNSMQTLTHSTGPGTPFPTGTSADFPGACFTCHMQGSSGVAQSHLFRINPSATYYTYPSAAQYYNNGTTALTTDPTAIALYPTVTLANGTWSYLNGTVTSYGVPSAAMINGTATTAYLATNSPKANDVDVVCGQCHGGGGSTDSRGDTNAPYTNPYGIPTTGAPYFNRTYLASIAVNMHGSLVTTTLTAPTFLPGSESSATSLSVTLSDATATATICYTTNAVNPTATTAGTCDPQLVSGVPTEFGVASGSSITVASTETVKAIATEVGDLNSPLAYATYTIGATAAKPTLSLNAGTYTLATSTSTLTSVLSDATTGATICYTLNGSTPTATVPGTCDAGETSVTSTSTTTPTATLTIATAETVTAIATLAGDVNSGVVSAAYALIPAAPTFSPGSETFYQSYVTTSYPSVTLKSNPGATFLYCAEATALPACTPTITYAPISVSCSGISTSGNAPCGVTIFANATFSGGTASSVSHATYFIKPGDPPGTPQANTPTFSPLPGVITATESVTITDTSLPAPVICYTLNGPVPIVNPTATSSSTGTAACTTGTLYTVPVPLNAVEGTITTIRATAGGTGYLHSAMAYGDYIFR